MKMIHTSDWHLGITLSKFPLADMQEHLVDDLISAAKEISPDAVIIAGDIFDSSVSNSEAIRIYNKAVDGLCAQLGIPVIIIAGNHDGAARLASCRTLLARSGLYITGKAERGIAPVSVGDTDIYPLPYFSIDEARALYPDEEILSNGDAFAAFCRDIASGMDRTRRNILAAHAFVGGAVTSESDRSAVIGASQMVGADIFSDFDYVALGHLHRPQKIGKNVYYSGSPLKYSKTEADQEKSFILLDTEDMSVRRIPIRPLREMRVIKGTLEEIRASASESDEYIHIELTDSTAGLDTMNYLREYYPNLLSVTGKTESGGTESQITAESINNISADDILKNFYNEIFGCTPDEELMELFHEAVEESGKGSDVQ